MKPDLFIDYLVTRYAENPFIRALAQCLQHGGFADTPLQARYDRIQRTRFELFIDELAVGGLSGELLNSDDFLHRFFCTTKAVLTARRWEKIVLFGKLLNGYKQAADPDEYEEMLQSLEQMSIRELSLLQILKTFELAQAWDRNQNELQSTRVYWHRFQAEACSALQISKQELPGYLTRLSRTGMYCEFTGTYLDYEGGVGRTTPLFARLCDWTRDGVL